MDFQGRAAIVTGGGSGIGRATALALAKRGAAVAVADLVPQRAQSVAHEIGQAGQKALGVVADVTQSQQVEALVEKTLAEWGQIDILVNSAGIFPQSPIQEMAEAEWDQVIEVNLKGTFLPCRAVLEHMTASRRGRIINISAGHGARGFPTGAHYAASKAGVNALTKSLALEVAPYGVLVNAIAPGPVDTPLPRGGRLYTEEEKKQLGAQLPLGRIGLPEEIAALAVFLASEECRWLTGQIVYQNGGDIMPG